MIKKEHIESDGVVFELPDGTQIAIDDIPGFSDLTEQQRYFIECYVENFPSISIALVRSGVRRTEMNAWNYESEAFHDVFNNIKDLHVEGLLIQEYSDSINNSKIRGRVLMALNAPGYEKKTGVTNNHLHIGDQDLFSTLSQKRLEDKS